VLRFVTQLTVDNAGKCSFGNWAIEPHEDFFHRDKFHPKEAKFTMKVSIVKRGRGSGKGHRVQVGKDLRFSRRLMAGRPHSLVILGGPLPETVINGEVLPTFTVKCLDVKGNVTASAPDEENEWHLDLSAGPLTTEQDLKVSKTGTKIKGLRVNVIESVPLGGKRVEQCLQLEQTGGVDSSAASPTVDLSILVLPSRTPTHLTVSWRPFFLNQSRPFVATHFNLIVCFAAYAGWPSSEETFQGDIL